LNKVFYTAVVSVHMPPVS